MAGRVLTCTKVFSAIASVDCIKRVLHIRLDHRSADGKEQFQASLRQLIRLLLSSDRSTHKISYQS